MGPNKKVEMSAEKSLKTKKRRQMSILSGGSAEADRLPDTDC